MVQKVWGKLAKNDLAEDSLIATCKSQVEMIHSQLGSFVPIVVEPD